MRTGVIVPPPSMPDVGAGPETSRFRPSAGEGRGWAAGVGRYRGSTMASGHDPIDPGAASEHRGAIVVVPTVVSGQQGPVAAWVSAAGWATGLRNLLGTVWVVTPEGPMEPDELRRRASAATLTSSSGPRWPSWVPVVANTARKDVREWRRARAFHVDPVGPWRGGDVACVWQRHELFHTAGPRLARELGVPSILFVPAPLVWQAQQWGVRRPGWRRLTEKFGERNPLRSADVVACGSDAVAEEVRRIGVDDDRIVITPTGADLELFRSLPDRDATRRRLGLDDRFVVGWVGSFRRFHALDQAVAALAGLEGATLLLVGDGPERASVERLARERGVALQCTGTVSHDDVPSYLAAMDVGLVLASSDQPFHYSPLKLAEYLAAGIAVVAPRAGALPGQLRDGVDAMLVSPGDPHELATVLRGLRDDVARRERLGRAARSVAGERWSWDRSARQALAAADRAASMSGSGR
jgi:glycosyltransferase involved in cell wall biosynthesis